MAHLRARSDVRVLEFDVGQREAELRAHAAEAEIIFHLAGVNRPRDENEFETGNAGFTQQLCDVLHELGRAPRIVFASSVQAAFDNPYGRSKARAEKVLDRFAAQSGAAVAIYRLKNVFGKWCRPNYNSVVATFCHNIAHDLPIQISDPDRAIDLVHVDDVVQAFLNEIDVTRPQGEVSMQQDCIPSYSLTLGDLAGRIQFFREMQESLRVPDFTVRFNQQLYSTYLSYVQPERWEYALDVKADARGNLAEFIKSPAFGQLFISRTHPGVVRGNHYHHVKAEKFLVVAGEGLIRLRQIEGEVVHEFRVKGDEYRVIDIPPGYAHSITNVGNGEMITLFWSSEVFDPDRADTYWMEA